MLRGSSKDRSASCHFVPSSWNYRRGPLYPAPLQPLLISVCQSLFLPLRLTSNSFPGLGSESFSLITAQFPARGFYPSSNTSGFKMFISAQFGGAGLQSQPLMSARLKTALSAERIPGQSG